MTKLLLAIPFGASLGIITGVVPGIHVNLVASTMIAMSPLLLQFADSLTLACFVMSLAIVHSFLDTLPSVYLGAPDPENALAALPSHKLVMEGKAHEAVLITIWGAYLGLLSALLLVPLFLFVANFLYPIIRPHLAILLVSVILFILLKGKGKFWNLLVFSLSGILGVVVFSLTSLDEPLFPLLSGLFGISSLLLSLSENTTIPKQQNCSEIDLRIPDYIKILSGSTIAVFLIQFFPGLGPAQGGVISNQIVREVKDKAYIAMIGAIGTMSVVFSIVTFYSMGKAKDGSVVAVSKLLELNHLAFICLLLVMLIAGSTAVPLVIFLSKHFSRLISKVNYCKLVICIIGFVTILCFILEGYLGILVLITSTAAGLIAPLKGVARSHSMGCLLLPVVCYLLL